MPRGRVNTYLNKDSGLVVCWVVSTKPTRRDGLAGSKCSSVQLVILHVLVVFHFLHRS